jgi:hypothetical protein
MASVDMLVGMLVDSRDDGRVDSRVDNQVGSAHDANRELQGVWSRDFLIGTSAVYSIT